MNWKVRMRNPWFWVGIVSAVVSALRVDVNALTSWGTVWSCLARIIENPVQLGTLCLTVLSVFIDPTTAGLGRQRPCADLQEAGRFLKKTPSLENVLSAMAFLFTCRADGVRVQVCAS